MADGPSGARANGEANGQDFHIDDGPLPESDDEVIARLAKLPPIEYGRARATEAERLGCRASDIDDAVKQVRGRTAEDGKQGRALELKRPEPWPEPVNLAVLLDAVADFLCRHVFLPPGAADALAAWVVHTYCFHPFRHSPRIGFTSPTKRCGKTTALDALGLLVCAPLPTANITAPALFRTIEAARPTLLIDEADTFLGNNNDLRGALNAGHKRDGQVIRCVGEDAEPRAFSVFGPAAIAAIGRLPGTLEDRAINVQMQRATRAERPEPLDAAAECEAERLARMCARWAVDNVGALASVDPILPSALFNRAADNWRPLFAIATRAGGGWSARLAQASATLAPDDNEGLSIRLLEDIRVVFDTRGIDKIGSADLCEALVQIEASPWAEASRGKPVTQNKLARLLRSFKIAPGTKRDGAETFKGYTRAAFEDAWRRYVAPAGPEEANEPSHRHNPQKTSVSAESDPSHTDPAVTDRKTLEPALEADCGGVTVQKHHPPGGATDRGWNPSTEGVDEDRVAGQWQPVGPDEILPAGCRIRMNVATGEKEVREPTPPDADAAAGWRGRL